MHSRESFLRHLVSTLVLLFLLCYFTYHTIYGKRGVKAYFALTQKLELSQSLLHDIRYMRMDSEHKVDLLRGDTDLDMLDEQARKKLGYLLPNEHIIIIDQDKQ